MEIICHWLLKNSKCCINVVSCNTVYFMNILITGAGRGIGYQMTKQLSEKGHTVYAIVRTVTDELRTLKNVNIIEGLDLENLSTIDQIADNSNFPKLDWVIMNAGIFLETPLKDLEIEAVQKQLQVNSVAPLYFVQRLLPKLSEGSKVGLVSSQMGSIGDNSSGGYYGYRMSKAALNMAGNTLAFDLKNSGIIVSIMHPGYVKTRMTDFMGNMDAELSATRLISVMENATIRTSGTFWNYQGNVLPW
jgi:NAD(P)-dependent dehydrogenase (short-subunit alcohol dehydrogenase family)